MDIKFKKMLRWVKHLDTKLNNSLNKVAKSNDSLFGLDDKGEFELKRSSKKNIKTLAKFGSMIDS